jgi:3-(3-hydroxy-phenyl)propionate hydroxylase
MHILERIGAVAPFLDKALGWRFGRSYYRGTQIFRLEMPHPDSEKYLPMYNLQQQYIEKYLHDAVGLPAHRHALAERDGGDRAGK